MSLTIVICDENNLSEIVFSTPNPQNLNYKTQYPKQCCKRKAGGVKFKNANPRAVIAGGG